MLRTCKSPQLAKWAWYLSQTITLVVGAVLIVAKPVHATVDTIYIDNTRSCPGGPGTTLTNAYCSIKTALTTVTGGPDTVFAVVGTGTVYRETGTVSIASADSGTAGHPFVLFARGAVTLDGANETSTWTAVPNNSTMWRTSVPATATSVTQVFLTGVPYPYVSFSEALADLPAGRCQLVASVDSVYVNFGSHPNWTSVNPTGVTGYVTLRHGIEVLSSNVTVKGFTIRRARDEGVSISGAVRNVTIANNDIRGSYRQGIAANNAASHHCTVQDNVASENGSYGIRLLNAQTDYSVVRNTCQSNLEVLAYLNQPVGRSSINGIRLGDRSSALDPNNIVHHNHLLEGNIVSHNQDSGIEIRTNYTTSRNNRSWSNQDHGFDHLWCTNVTHIGDLSWGNNRDGMSFEGGTHNMTVRNCVIANNGRDRCRRDWELEVGATAKLSWSSDYNVIWRDVSAETSDSILIKFRGGLAADSCTTVQCTTMDSCFKTVAAFNAKFPSHEVHGQAGQPTFVDSAGADFRPQLGSSVIDVADTSGTLWLPRDVRGFVRHDQLSVANGGDPGDAYGDAGPYEYDDGSAWINVSWGYENLTVNWTAPGVEQNYGTADYYEVFRNGSEVLQVDNPEAAGSLVCVELGSLPSCSAMDLKVKYTYVGGYTVEGNTVSGSTTCTASVPTCESYLGGGGGSSARRPREETEPIVLALGTPEPSPSAGVSQLKWSIPRSEEGAHYELAMFDVAGRRVSTISSGIAKAGRYVQQLGFQTDNGVPLRNGIFFMRLRIGRQELRRTVILAR